MQDEEHVVCCSGSCICKRSLKLPSCNATPHEESPSTSCTLSHLHQAQLSVSSLESMSFSSFCGQTSLGFRFASSPETPRRTRRSPVFPMYKTFHRGPTSHFGVTAFTAFFYYRG